jgi:hypothetical protein
MNNTYITLHSSLFYLGRFKIDSTYVSKDGQMFTDEQLKEVLDEF